MKQFHLQQCRQPHGMGTNRSEGEDSKQTSLCFELVCCVTASLALRPPPDCVLVKKSPVEPHWRSCGPIAVVFKDPQTIQILLQPVSQHRDRAGFPEDRFENHSSIALVCKASVPFLYPAFKQVLTSAVSVAFSKDCITAHSKILEIQGKINGQRIGSFIVVRPTQWRTYLNVKNAFVL